MPPANQRADYQPALIETNHRDSTLIKQLCPCACARIDVRGNRSAIVRRRV